MGLEGEIKGIDGLGGGQAGDLHGGLDPPLVLDRDFLLQEVIQEGNISLLPYIIQHF